MKKTVLLSLAVLSGCVSGPVLYLHKTGSSVAERQEALDQCRVEAIRRVPAQQRVIYSPGAYSPGTTQCSSAAGVVSCNTYGGLNIPASIDTVDDNAGLRQREITRCLAAKGFNVVEMPRCQGKKDYEGDVQPPMSQITCATPRLQN